MRFVLNWVIGILMLLALAGLIFAVSTAHAAEGYPPDSVGRLLYEYGDRYRDGYITGVSEGLFASGMVCPGIVSGNILREALRSEVVDGHIALTDRDITSLVKSAAALGCSAPWGTKGTRSVPGA